MKEEEHSAEEKLPRDAPKMPRDIIKDRAMLGPGGAMAPPV